MPKVPAKGGIVVIQEIFGVNHHIARICDGSAEEGYTRSRPALSTAPRRVSECGYHARRDRQCAQVHRQSELGRDAQDTQAAIDELKKEGRSPSWASAWAASIAFLAATRLNGLSAAVAYYGGVIASSRREAKGRCRCISARRTRASR